MELDFEKSIEPYFTQPVIETIGGQGAHAVHEIRGA